MERSLSILLPVHNVQNTLAASVSRLLDIAADLTERFELLIVDDGSTDRTVEVAHDLAVLYPQVDVVRHTHRKGLAEVVRRGLPRTSGEIVCVHEGEGAVDIADLRELWRLRDQEDLVLARHGRQGTADDPGWIERLWSRGNAPAKQGSGFHMLRRRAIEGLGADRILTAEGHEVRLCRTDSGPITPSRLRRPNFLSQLKRLAFGE